MSSSSRLSSKSATLFFRLYVPEILFPLKVTSLKFTILFFISKFALVCPIELKLIFVVDGVNKIFPFKLSGVPETFAFRLSTYMLTCGSNIPYKT